MRTHADNSLVEELFRPPLARYNGIGNVAALEAGPKNGIIGKINKLKLDIFVAGFRPN